MRTKLTITFLGAALVGGLMSSCYVAQPPFECQPAASGYWANFTLVSKNDPDDVGCGEITGDTIRVQRYLPPGTRDGTVAVAASSMLATTRKRSPADNQLFRYDPTDPKYTKESARGPLTTIEADATGVCRATLQPADQTLPEATFTKSDGGMTVFPEEHIKYDYTNFRFINTARFPGTILASTVDVTYDTCTAKYEVMAIWPPVGCETDADCSPEPNLDAGHSVGSGLSADYNPKCGPDGVCVSSKTFEELVNLK